MVLAGAVIGLLVCLDRVLVAVQRATLRRAEDERRRPPDSRGTLLAHVRLWNLVALGLALGLACRGVVAVAVVIVVDLVRGVG